MNENATKCCCLQTFKEEREPHHGMAIGEHRLFEVLLASDKQHRQLLQLLASFSSFLLALIMSTTRIFNNLKQLLDTSCTIHVYVQRKCTRPASTSADWCVLRGDIRILTLYRFYTGCLSRTAPHIICSNIICCDIFYSVDAHSKLEYKVRALFRLYCTVAKNEHGVKL